MNRLIHVPHGIEDIYDTYGDPDKDGDWDLDPGWYRQNTAVFTLPYPLRLSWNFSRSVRRLRFHVLVGPAIVDALSEIASKHSYEKLKANDWDILGGAYHFRKMVAYPALSTHSWGIAIDLNNHVAGWGKDPKTQPDFIVAAFRVRGFDWGGDWPPKYTSDPMHFQAATGY